VSWPPKWQVTREGAGIRAPVKVTAPTTVRTDKLHSDAGQITITINVNK